MDSNTDAAGFDEATELLRQAALRDGLLDAADPPPVDGVPGEAARRSTGNTLGAGQQSGGTVINIQRIDVLGAIDEDSAEKIGEGLRRAGLTREGAA